MSELLLSIPSSGIAGNTSQQSYTQYTYGYTATLAQTYLTFEFRQDPAYWALDDIAVTNANGVNLVGNGGFEAGLADWTLIGVQGLNAAGQVSEAQPGMDTGSTHSGSRYFYDGAVGGVDGIYQAFNTVVGQAYTVSFWLANDGGGTAIAQVKIGAKEAAYAAFASTPSIAGPTDGLPLAGGGVLTGHATPAITGLADAGATVTVAVDGVAIGSVAADENGHWSISPASPLSDGAHAVSATAQVGGSASSPAAALSLTVDTTAPAAAGQPVLAADSDSGTSGDLVTNVTLPTLSGTAEAGSTVQLYDGATLLGTAVADAVTGAWTITATTPLTEGSNSLTAVAVDAAGNVSPASTSLVVTLDTVAPPAVTLALAASSDSGAPGDALTNVALPTLAGTAEPGSTVTVRNGAVVVGTAVADAVTGGWSVVVDAALAEGANSLTATATDAAGNVSAASPALVVTLDTIVPAAPGAPVLAPGSDGGTPGDGVTDVALPTITGTAEPGATIRLFNGATLVGTAAADPGTGAWSVTLGAALAEGANGLTAVAVDAAGNASASSQPLAVTLQSAPAAVLSVALDAPGDTATTGDTVLFTVDLSKPVQIAGGTPALVLNNGAVAVYDPVRSTPDHLVFAYTVAVGADVPSLAVTGLSLADATAVDGNGIAADLGGVIKAPANTVQVNTGFHPFAALEASSPDPSAIVTVSVSVRPAIPGFYGNLGIGSMGPDGVTYSVTGTAAEVNAALDGVLLSPAPGAPALAGLTASLTDLDGEEASRLLNAGAFGSTLDALAPGDFVVGGTGADTLTAGASGNTLFGGSGATTLVGHIAGTTMVGGTGHSTFFSRGGPTLIVGGSAADTISAALGEVTVISAAGGHTLVGLGNGPALVSGQGADTVFGGAGPATVVAAANSLIGLGSGRASVSAAGNSTVVGGTGDSLVAVRDGGAVMFAGPGATTFIGGTGSSTVIGGAGGGSLLMAGAGGGVFSSGTGGNNTVVGGQQATVIFGGGDGDVLFAMGSAGTTVRAGTGNQTLQGGYSSGADVFVAGSGSTLIGLGSGEDAVFAGSGSSTVVAGTGRDTFAFVNGQAGGTEVILGFKTGVDRISLQGYADGELARALAASTYTQGSATAAGGATMTLSDNTHIVFTNLARLGPGVFG